MPLIGFDEVDLADLLDPPVAVVAQDVDRIGHTAAELAFERLRGTRTGPGEHFRIPTELRLRPRRTSRPGWWSLSGLLSACVRAPTPVSVTCTPISVTSDGDAGPMRQFPG